MGNDGSSSFACSFALGDTSRPLFFETIDQFRVSTRLLWSCFLACVSCYSSSQRPSSCCDLGCAPEANENLNGSSQSSTSLTRSHSSLMVYYFTCCDMSLSLPALKNLIHNTERSQRTQRLRLLQELTKQTKLCLQTNFRPKLGSYPSFASVKNLLSLCPL